MPKKFPSSLCKRIGYFIKDESRASLTDYPELFRELRRADPKSDFKEVAGIPVDEMYHHKILTEIYNTRCKK